MRLISWLSFWAITCSPVFNARAIAEPLPELLSFEEISLMTSAEQTQYMYEFGKLLAMLEDTNAKYELAGMDTRDTKELIAKVMRGMALISEAQAEDAPSAPAESTPNPETLKPQGPAAFSPNPAKATPAGNFTPRPAGDSSVAPPPGPPNLTPLSGGSALTNYEIETKPTKGRGRRGRAGGSGPGGVPAATPGTPAAAPAATPAATLAAPAAPASPAAAPGATPAANSPVTAPGPAAPAKDSADEGGACVPTKNRAEHQALLNKFSKDKSNHGECIRGGFFSNYDKGAYRYGGCKAPPPPKKFTVDGKVHHLKTTCPTAGEEMCNPSVYCVGIKTVKNGHPAFKVAGICAKVDAHWTRSCHNSLKESLDQPMHAPKKVSAAKRTDYENSKVELCPRNFAGIEIADYYRGLFADTQKSYQKLCGGNKNFKALFCEECGLLGQQIAGMVKPYVEEHKRMVTPVTPAVTTPGAGAPPPPRRTIVTPDSSTTK